MNKKNNIDIESNIISNKDIDFNLVNDVIDISKNKESQENTDFIKKNINKLTYGMYLVTTKANEVLNGQTANTVFQITSDPIKIAISLNNNNYTTELIKKSKKVAIHIMGEDSFNILSAFGYVSGRIKNKFKDYEYEIEENLPLLKKYSLNILIGHVNYHLNINTHTLFIIEVTKAFMNEKKINIKPLSYYEFRILKKNKLSKDYVNDINKTSIYNKQNKVYICTICGYIYDENIEKKTFKNLSKNYVCPICYADKEKFKLKY